MDSEELSVENGAIFDFAFDNDYPFVKPGNFTLYHYRSVNSVGNIFNGDSIRLRMNRSDQFSDKMEGKAVEVYYDMALEELLAEGEITEEQFTFLSQIEPSNEEMFIFREDNDLKNAKCLEYDAYIICFSKVKNDPYMFEHYGSQAEDKYCLELLTSQLEVLSHEDLGVGTRTEIIPVMYGKEVVSFLKNKIRQVVNNQFLYMNASILIDDLLHTIQFSAKRARYSKENEVRLVVFLPHGAEYFDKRYVTDKEKKCLWLNLPTHSVCNYWPKPGNSAENDEKIKNMLRTRGYSFLLD